MTINDLMEFITGWFRYYIILPKAVPFILGLILVHSWVEYALVALLITHLADVLQDLRKAAAAVNILDGTTAVLTLIMAYLSETYLGPFLALVCITTAYFFGLLLFYLGSVKTWLLYVSVILVGLGQGGCDIQLKEFLSDQCRTTEEAAGEDEERVESRRKIWWRSAYMLGIVASVFLFIEAEWKELCLILIIAMTVAFVVFLLGFSFYERKKPAKSTLYNIMQVLYTAITNRRRRHPLEYRRVNIQTLSVFNRWLDRAAVEESSSGGGRVFTVEQVEEVKSLLNMLPFWSMSFIYGLMLATGNTFFYQQTEYTANYLGPISPLSSEQSDIYCNDSSPDFSIKVPAIIFVIIRYSVLFVVSRLCDFLLRLRWGNDIPRRVLLVRSGVGLAVSPLCCLVAWKVEERRRHRRLEHGVCIRFSWLIPQFVLLGVMEGLVQEAMEEFFVCVVPQRLGRYAPAFTMFAQSIGHFGSLLFIFIFRSLFDKDDLDYSKLGAYYRNLSYVCCVNLVIYCCVAAYYAKQELSGGGGGDEVMMQSLEQMHEQGHESVGVVGDEQVG